MVDQAGDLVELPTNKWGEAVLAVSDLGEPRYGIFVDRVGFEGALASDAQRKGMSWPLKVIEPYLSFADLANLFDQNEELSSLQLPTEIRLNALKEKLEVYGRRPTGGPLQRIPPQDFDGFGIDTNWRTRKASVVSAYGPIWVDRHPAAMEQAVKEVGSL